MGLLDQLLSGGQDRDRFDDFTRRYDKGAPDEGYDDDEVQGHYRQLDNEIDDDTYQASARDAFARMQPEERSQFGSMLRGAARDRGHNDLDEQYDQYGDDPDSLAKYAGRARRQDPDLLGSLLGGGSGAGGAAGALGGLLGGSGGAAGGLGDLLGGGSRGGQGGIAGNPIARAALAGITAMAVKRMTSR